MNIRKRLEPALDESFLQRNCEKTNKEIGVLMSHCEPHFIASQTVFENAEN